jgi:hypothetical protein
VAVGVEDDARAEPLVWIRTTEGPTCLTTWTNCCCRASADGLTSTAGDAVDELALLAAIEEQPASTSAAARAATASGSRRPRMRYRVMVVPFLR